VNKIFIFFVSFILLLTKAYLSIYSIDSALRLNVKQSSKYVKLAKHDILKIVEVNQLPILAKVVKLKRKYSLSPNSVKLASITSNLSINAFSNTVFCSGDSVELYTRYVLGNSYQWYSSQGGKICTNTLISGAIRPSYFANVSGDYFLSVLDQNGNLLTSNIINVTVNPSPIVNILTNGPLTFCQGGSVVLTASAMAGNSFQWSNGTNHQSVSLNASGSYSVSVTNLKNGCSTRSKSITVSVYTLRTDINIDGITDYSDYLLLIQMYNGNCLNCKEDIDQDGIVKNDDFLKLLGDYNLYCY